MYEKKEHFSLGKVTEKDIMKMHSKELDTRAMAGSEDCLNLAVFTPRVSLELQGDQ